MVREIGRQPFAPVAARIIDKDGVAPPVVQDLVRVRRVQDERKADDPRPEERERGHAVAGVPEVLDEGELAVGVGADQLAIHLDVLGRGLEVLRRQVGIRSAQERVGRDVTGRTRVLGEGRGDEIDLVHGLRRVPRDRAPPLRGIVPDPRALAHRVPSLGQFDLDPKRQERFAEVGQPPRASREHDPLLLDGPRRAREAARVFLALLDERMVDPAVVTQLHRDRSRSPLARRAQSVLAQRRRCLSRPFLVDPVAAPVRHALQRLQFETVDRLAHLEASVKNETRRPFRSL